MTLEQIKTRSQYWCDLLGVDAMWDVSLSIGNTANLAGLCGKNELVAEEQLSHITIAHDEGEDTLVHEILHILFDGYKSSEDMKYNPLHELAINKVAYALVQLAAKKKKTNGKQTTGKTSTSSVKPKAKQQPRKKRNTTATASTC